MRNDSGVLIYTSPVAVSVARVIHAPLVNIRPDGGGRLLLHSGDIDGTDGEPAVVGPIVAAARALYPGIRDATVESVRVGVRPKPSDGLPVLGRALGLSNFYFAVSHSGATLSVHVGDLIAAEVLGVDQGDALAPFRFERFAR
jgi:glycine/D-amino acid oxidase-like deaminating enzyme